MSIFLGSNKGETITPDSVSSSVVVVGNPKKPSAAADIIFAGGGDDTVAGGGGNDIVSLGAGNDTFIWNGGDGNDIVTGDGGDDTLQFNGANVDEEIEISSLLGAVAVKGTVDLVFKKVSSTLLLDSMERLEFATLGGADKINIKGLSGTDVKEVAIDLGVNGAGDGAIDRVSADATGKADTIAISDDASGVAVTGLPVTVSLAHADAHDVLTINSGAGNDTIDASALSADRIQLEIVAGDGNDKITGSAGSDLIVGGRGDDVAHMGAGDDTFVWNPGEGSDTVEGGDGYYDALDFVGNGANENVDISADGDRVRFFRDVANVTMDLHDVERIVFSSLGGADTLHIGDLKGTGLENVTVEMGATRDTRVGDGATDVVTVDGSADDDSIDVGFANGAADVNLFHTFVSLVGIEAGDKIIVNGGDGSDSIGALNVLAGAPSLVLDGGAGDDFILGSANADTLIGGDGNDVIDGGRGNDTAFLGAGDDRFVWDPGEGSDVVEGGDGADIMEFNGANVAENVDISADGERTRFFRDVANITMDLNDVERATFNALGGEDTVTVRALTGWDVREVEISLAGELFGTTGDGAIDTIIVEGGEDGTIMSIGGALDVFSIDSGSAYVGVVGAETQDRVIVKGLGGDDMIIAHPFTTGGISLTIDGGAGDDFIQGANGVETVFGGDGNDFVDGNEGNDIAFLGAGDDIFQWDPGDGSDSVEGGDGFDEMFFNGNAAGENIDIRANGERITFFRNLGNITMDLNDVEQSTFNALGGADTVVVHALDPFEVHTVKIDLAGEFLGTTGDGAEDTIVVEDNDQFDLQTLSGTLEQFTVSPGNTFVDVRNAEAHDHLIVKAGNGADSLDASGFVTGGLDLTLDGGAGNDFIQGANGAETVFGGDGDDTVDGNRGDDVAFLGAGDDAFVWDPGDGSDVVEGGEGIDILDFNGAGANEIVDISAVGNRVQFLRNVANIDMDLNSVEAIRFTALGGTDDITVHDLSGTDVQEVSIDLAGPLGDGTPDGQLDTVTLEATNDQDFIDVFGSAESVAILGAGPAFVTVDRFDATDRLTIKSGAGDDQISASGQLAAMQMTLDGGAGDDTIFGSAGADTLIGGDGDDFIDGNRGDDIAILGAGDDIFVWDPGDGSDTIEGGEGQDFMGFRGANVAENVSITANGERVSFFRDVANITMDLNDVESTTFNAFGGVDNIDIGDLTGTDMERIELSLIGGSGQANDGLQDSIAIAGSVESDAVSLSTTGSLTRIDGLAAQVQITGADAALDRLQINTGAGGDAVDASALKANLFQFGVSLGDGNDAFIGSAGKDVVDGGEGFDVLSGEDGDDVLDGGAGLDILTGGAGNDLFVNGEIIQDFIAGAGSEDRIDLRALGANFDWVMEHATDTDAGVLFDFDGEQMLLGGVNAASLHQDDFLLA